MLAADQAGGRAEGRAPLGLVVIGHVNHGKTALVRALTGAETDRLKEEIARGMSITPGFAWRDYPGGGVDFIDAPGHENFIRAMITGAAGARAALLVVSAVEGFGRQTYEHVRIAGLLGVTVGVVAATKCDLLAPGASTAVAEQIKAELGGTILDGEPVVFCSSRTGEGLDAVNEQLRVLAGRSPSPNVGPGAFLPLDRTFSLAGAGTVATGTLQGGPLEAGQGAVLQPSGRAVVLRQLQIHGRTVEQAAPGGRVAVGLRGVSANALEAGEVVCAPGAYEASLLIDAELMLSRESAKPLKAMDEVRVMWGARQELAKVRLFGTNALAPGGRGLAQLRFGSPVIAYAGQRGVLRRPSPAETIGGLLVLDPVAPAIRGRAEARRALLEAVVEQDLNRIAEQMILQNGGVVRLAEAARLSRRSVSAVSDGLTGNFVPLDEQTMALRSRVADVRRSYLESLAQAHREAPAQAWVPAGAVRGSLTRAAARDLVAHVEQGLAAAGDVRLKGACVALPDHDPFTSLSPAGLTRLNLIEERFRAGGMTPPALGELADADPDDPVLVGLLIESERLVALRNVALRQTLVFHAGALAEALMTLRAAFPPPTAFTTGEARAALQTSRKFIVPAMELFDQRGETRREGDTRRLVDPQNSFDLAPNAL